MLQPASMFVVSFGLARQGAIRFDAVRFSYPTRPEAEVLKGLTLEIAAGQTVAVVGASGQSTARARCASRLQR